ncbi:MAG: hypothetical protein EB127_02565 [Alphaproteobacteria bacterium]|nr:hypothetical protein [Alphaproteobacteria bacterium]
MWQITALGSFLPDWFWYALLILGLVCLAAAWFLGNLPIISQYRFNVQLIGIFSLLISIWFLGAASNEDKWKEKLRIAEEEKAAIEVKAKAANEKLAADLKDALNKNEDLRKVNNQQASALSNALKDGKATVSTIRETVLQNMTPAERAEYEKKNAEQKAEYDKKIADLLEKYKTCPSIPAFTVDQIDQKIRPSRRPAESKQEEKK